MRRTGLLRGSVLGGAGRRHGASVLALQIALHRDATVIATRTSSCRNRSNGRELQSDEPLSALADNFGRQMLQKGIRSLTRR
jgi:hypothetical protein